MNLIRLILACLVIISHATWLGGRYGRTPLYAGETYGAWAVYGFFVLSGYLIAGSRLRHDFGAFVKRRVLRMYPGYAVCLIAVVAFFAPIGYWHKHGTLSGYLTTQTTPLDYVFSNITMRRGAGHVAGTPTNVHEWIGSTWTLYYEFVCYLLVGGLASWAMFRRHVVVAIALLIAVTTARVELFHFVNIGPGLDLDRFLRLIPYFMAGSVLYLLSDRLPCRWWLALIAAVAFAAISYYGGRRWLACCALPAGYVLLYLGAVVPIYLGRRNDLSYGMYLYGYPVEQLLRLVAPGNRWAFTGLALVATVPFALASWFLIERPAMRWGRVKGAPSTRTGPPRGVGGVAPS